MAHNNYFAFKQFTVWQNHAAMRVGTDGVLLGAWAKAENCQTLLDIGTGTGLIALMLSQRTHAQIDAIDIDNNAIADAGHNFKLSPWANRLNLETISLQELSANGSRSYDGIICNPPFFNNSEKSENHSRKVARHTDLLSFEELANGVSKLLVPNGKFWVVLPATEEKWFVEIASECGLSLSEVTRVKPNSSKPPVRVLLEFVFGKAELVETELTIETEIRHHYTPEFKKLVKDFYLKE